MNSFNLSKFIPMVILIGLIFLSMEAAAARTHVFTTLRRLLQYPPGYGYGNVPYPPPY